jgi:hypothetical protein
MYVSTYAELHNGILSVITVCLFSITVPYTHGINIKDIGHCYQKVPTTMDPVYLVLILNYFA